MRCETEFEHLLALHEGRLPEPKANALRAHLLGGCAECAETYSWLGRVVAAIKGAVRLDALDADARLDTLAARARALFETRFPKQRLFPLVAQLLFDSRDSFVPSFARGDHGEAYQQLYSAPPYNVELWEENLGKGRWYVIGQVLPTEDSASLTPDEVVLVDAAGTISTAQPFQGEFHVPNVASGRYEIRIRLKDLEIVLPNVDFSA